MLSTFPDLFTYALIAPFLLRVAVGLFLIYTGWNRYKKSYKWMSLPSAVAGILLVIGLFTQLSAIAGIILLGFEMWADKKVGMSSCDRNLLQTFCIIICISLLFLGAGAFAFDYPL